MHMGISLFQKLESENYVINLYYYSRALNKKII